MEQNTRNGSPMSNEGRNAYAVEHLTNALLSLLKDKPIAEISISELCDRAGVGRTTFYRNFEAKEDIIKAHIQRLFHEWTDGLAENPPLDVLIRTMFTHLETHRELYCLLNERGLIHLLKDVILAACGFRLDQESIAVYASAFAAYSLYGWVEVWFLRGMRESAEEMAALLQANGA